MEDKKTIRREMKTLNRALPAAERTAAAARIMEQIEPAASFAAARTIGLFCSLPDEPPTEGMIRRWCGSKRIVLPRVEGDVMQFYAYDPATLCEGAFGISEPAGGEACDPACIDLLVVPGVAFTRTGERLGRGRGYYDKYLSQPGFRAVKMGICYAHQLAETLPSEPHDVRMDAVIAG